MQTKTPIALTIAGSDSGGGAGIQADLKAMSANGAYGASVITAVTAQNTVAVTAVHAVPLDVVSAQIDAVMSDLDVSAIKLGMLFSPDLIDVVANALSGFPGPIVVDPVMIAKSGDALLQDVAVDALTQKILPLATVLTPNLPEAARLLNTDEATSITEMIDQGHALLALGPKTVLMKGGHGTGNHCTDVLVGPDGVMLELTSQRVNTQNTHGTGCTYSASIAAQLAQSKPLSDAVASAHAYLKEAIIAADSIDIGNGHGPVHHFHQVWS